MPSQITEMLISVEIIRIQCVITMYKHITDTIFSCCPISREEK